MNYMILSMFFYIDALLLGAFLLVEISSLITDVNLL